MIDGMKVLAIIPARGGSKGLPGKNIRSLCGKPLIAWSITQGLESKYIDKVLVSSDSEEIIATAKQFGADAPFVRPAELATDESTTYEAIQHALTYLKTEENEEYDFVVLLEPTSPLRENGDIDRMLETLTSQLTNFDSIISIGEVAEHPSIMKRKVGNVIEPFCPELSQTTRRQDNDPAYFPYGVAYIAKTSTLVSEGTFYTRRCTYFELKRFQNFEIDDFYNFMCVESIMKYEWGLK